MPMLSVRLSEEDFDKIRSENINPRALIEGVLRRDKPECHTQNNDVIHPSGVSGAPPIQQQKPVYDWQQRSRSRLIERQEIQELRNEVIRGIIQEKELMRILVDPKGSLEQTQAVDIEKIKSEVEQAIKIKLEQEQEAYDEAFTEGIKAAQSANQENDNESLDPERMFIEGIIKPAMQRQALTTPLSNVTVTTRGSPTVPQ